MDTVGIEPTTSRKCNSAKRARYPCAKSPYSLVLSEVYIICLFLCFCGMRCSREYCSSRRVGKLNNEHFIISFDMDTTGFSQVGRYGTISLLKRNEEHTVVTSFGIDAEELTFGRERTCGVRLYYSDVALLHCKVVFEERKVFKYLIIIIIIYHH